MPAYVHLDMLITTLLCVAFSTAVRPMTSLPLRFPTLQCQPPSDKFQYSCVTIVGCSSMIIPLYVCFYASICYDICDLRHMVHQTWILITCLPKNIVAYSHGFFFLQCSVLEFLQDSHVSHIQPHQECCEANSFDDKEPESFHHSFCEMWLTALHTSSIV